MIWLPLALKSIHNLYSSIYRYSNPISEAVSTTSTTVQIGGVLVLQGIRQRKSWPTLSHSPSLIPCISGNISPATVIPWLYPRSPIYQHEHRAPPNKESSRFRWASAVLANQSRLDNPASQPASLIRFSLAFNDTFISVFLLAVYPASVPLFFIRIP